MPFSIRYATLPACRSCALVVLLLFLIAQPARAQGEITIEEKQTLDDLTFAFDLAIGNVQLFAGGDGLIRYLIDDTGQAGSPLTIPYNGDPVALAATDALLAVGDFASTLTLFDISDAANPTQRGAAATAGATLDIVAGGDLVITTPDVFTATNVVEFFDVSDPDTPVRVSQYQPGAFAAGLFLVDSGTELLVATQEKLEIVDISDPANPALLGSVDLAGRGAAVTLIGTVAFVGSQGAEDPQTGETAEWFLEAFDVSDLTAPQLIAATGDDDGPLHALIRLEGSLVALSSPSGVQALGFNATTAAFKAIDMHLAQRDPTGPSATALAAIFPSTLPGLPNNCHPLFTNAATTLPGGFYGQTGLSGDGDIFGFQVKTPPGSEAVLTTSYDAAPSVECPEAPGTGVNIGGGAVSAEGEGAWTLNTMTFTVETFGGLVSISSIRTEFIDKIELTIDNKKVTGDLVPVLQTVTNPVTNEINVLNYVQKIVFSGLGVPIPSGESKSYTIELFHKQTTDGQAICSVLEPVKREIVQLSIHGVNDVGATGPAGGVQRPNTQLLGNVIDLACVINVTPDPVVGFGFIQAGINGSANGDHVGVCPGQYQENVTFSETQTGRTLFSFNGPRETEIRSLAGDSTDVVTIAGNETTLQGFAITKGANGVAIKEGVAGVLIGPEVALKQEVAINELTLCTACNRIGGNSHSGVQVLGQDAQIRGNFIGTDAEGEAADLNDDGVTVLSAGTNTRIDANLISGNDLHGISNFGNNTIITRNFIGLDREGRSALPNNFRGINIEGSAEGVRIGGQNVISGNRDIGIEVSGKKTRIFGNIIGLTASGILARPNGSEGIRVVGDAANTRIGGLTADSLNMIAAHSEEGIFISDNADRVHVLGNVIGLNILGNATAPDSVGNRDGIHIKDNSGGDITIGGTEQGAGNVISGNTRNGILVDDGPFNLKIQGNIIGLDPDGDERRSNRLHGINVSDKGTVFAPSKVLIGGSTQSASNVISSNGGDGVFITSYNGTICGNIIGLDKQGTEDRGNAQHGIRLHFNKFTTIGDDDDGAFECLPNIISANGESGIDTEGSNGVILGNFIGVGFAETGTVPRPNGKNGIEIFESKFFSIKGNTIQGDGSSRSGNSLGRKIGIFVVASKEVTLLKNIIRRNATGIAINDTRPVDVLGNRLEENDTCAAVSDSKGVGVETIGIFGFVFSSNALTDCSGSATGLHLTDVENALIAGNHFENNAGAGVMIEGASSGIIVSRNNFIGNPDFGILNQGTDSIDANHNFWGTADGPSGEGTGTGDAVSTGVDFSNFRNEMVSVVVGAAADTAAVPIATPDTVDVFVQNFADLAGTLSVTATDELGWLSDGSPQSVTVTLQDSLGGVVELAALVPAGTPEGTLNRVTLDAVSTVDSTQFDSVTLVLVADDPTTNVAIEADPEAEAGIEVPAGFRLTAAYPNPFNPQAQFTLTLGTTQRVEVVVYDVLGRRVAVLHEGALAGQQAHRFVLDGRSWPSGVYYYQVVGEHFIETRSVMLVK